MASTTHLYLIRHGLAAQRGDAFPDDTKRPLTPDGVTRLRREARGLQGLGVKVDLILTSPLVRAQQTAEVLAPLVATSGDIKTLDSLAPGGSVSATIAALADYARHASIALVGHEPDMGELAAKLVGTRTAIGFKKGAVCHIDVDGLPPTRPGRLVWFATPKMLRKLGKS